MERKHKWQSQGSLCYLLLSLGWRETSVQLIYFNLTKRSGKSAEQLEWTIFHLVFPLAPAFTETNE